MAEICTIHVKWKGTYCHLAFYSRQNGFIVMTLSVIGTLFWQTKRWNNKCTTQSLYSCKGKKKVTPFLCCKTQSMKTAMPAQKLLRNERALELDPGVVKQLGSIEATKWICWNNLFWWMYLDCGVLLLYQTEQMRHTYRKWCQGPPHQVKQSRRNFKMRQVDLT
jgi:hypothetical protein